MLEMTFEEEIMMIKRDAEKQAKLETACNLLEQGADTSVIMKATNWIEK